MTDKKPKIYKANNILLQKVGSGPIDPKIVKKAQNVIENNPVDFSPLALEILKDLHAALQDIVKEHDKDKISALKTSIIQSVMSLKANAGMFHYPLVGELTDIMLSFLETIKEFDADAIDIVSAHHDTLNAIIQKKMTGKESLEQGQSFIIELKDACARYYRKKKA